LVALREREELLADLLLLLRERVGLRLVLGLPDLRAGARRACRLLQLRQRLRLRLRGRRVAALRQALRGLLHRGLRPAARALRGRLRRVGERALVGLLREVVHRLGEVLLLLRQRARGLAGGGGFRARLRLRLAAGGERLLRRAQRGLGAARVAGG